MLNKLILIAATLFTMKGYAQVIDFRPGNNQPGWSQGYIQAQITHCYSDLCTASLSWRTTGWKGAVVTVESDSVPQPKLFACTGTTGTGQAPWIKPGENAVFRLYESDRCTADVGYYDYQLDQVTVFVNKPPGPGPGPGPGGNFGNIRGFKNGCYSDLCTYSISWGTNWGSSSTVLTVQIPGETPEKLMACEGSQGQAQASWIAPGKLYVFRVYEVNNMCTADVSHYARPASQLMIRDMGFTPIR